MLSVKGGKAVRKNLVLKEKKKKKEIIKTRGGRIEVLLSL